MQILAPGINGIDIYYPTVSGVVVNSSYYDGIQVNYAGNDGFWANNPAGSGFVATGPDIDGLQVRSPVFDGVWVDSPGSDGVDVNRPAANGLKVDNPGNAGAYINSGRYGVYVDSSLYAGISVNYTNGNGFESYYAGDDGIALINPSWHGVYAYNPGQDGVLVYSPGDDGVDVWYPGGNCYECNGYPSDNNSITKFKVTNKCEVYSNSFKQYITNEAGEGIAAQVPAATEKWIEHSGEAALNGGYCRVDLPGDLINGATINREHKMQVFITPYAPMEGYWVERGDTYFIVHCSSGDPNANFAYNVKGRVMGYENEKVEYVNLKKEAELEEQNEPCSPALEQRNLMHADK
jgi:hypothetical protein